MWPVTLSVNMCTSSVQGIQRRPKVKLECDTPATTTQMEMCLVTNLWKCIVQWPMWYVTASPFMVWITQNIHQTCNILAIFFKLWTRLWESSGLNLSSELDSSNIRNIAWPTQKLSHENKHSTFFKRQTPNFLITTLILSSQAQLLLYHSSSENWEVGWCFGFCVLKLARWSQASKLSQVHQIIGTEGPVWVFLICGKVNLWTPLGQSL